MGSVGESTPPSDFKLQESPAMTSSITPVGLSRRFRQASLGLAAAGALMALPQQAQALTLVLDFTSVSITEDWGPDSPATLVAADFAPWGFTMDLAQIKTSVLAAVNHAYLGYPTADSNALSPLPAGQRLNISFELGTVGIAPTNGDSEYYYFGVGKTNGTEDELGHACGGCVRSADLGAATVAVGSMVGVNFTNNLQGLTGGASFDDERINILAGTIAHEFGHALLLDHPTTAAPYAGLFTNPGASQYSIMATGASPSDMPDDQRLTTRAFSYAEFGTLINTVGVTPVPEPSAFLLMAGGLGLLAFARRRRAAA